MITTATGERRYTLREVAASTGRNLNTVRVYASRHDLGIWIGDMRFLSDDDVARIQRARTGRPRGSRNRQTGEVQP